RRPNSVTPRLFRRSTAGCISPTRGSGNSSSTWSSIRKNSLAWILSLATGRARERKSEAFLVRVVNRRPALAGGALELSGSPDDRVDEGIRHAGHRGHRQGGKLGLHVGTIQVGVCGPQSHRRLYCGPLQPEIHNLRESVCVVGGDLHHGKSS